MYPTVTWRYFGWTFVQYVFSFLAESAKPSFLNNIFATKAFPILLRRNLFTPLSPSLSCSSMPNYLYPGPIGRSISHLEWQFVTITVCFLNATQLAHTWTDSFRFFELLDKSPQTKTIQNSFAINLETLHFFYKSHGNKNKIQLSII